jgi:hypothetical protein
MKLVSVGQSLSIYISIKKMHAQMIKLAEFIIKKYTI